jgi:signal transduction histidine kinase/DNA-binding response OmpR family regulator
MSMTSVSTTQPHSASLKVKAMVFISLIILAVGASLSWYLLRQTQGVLMEGLQKRAMSLAHNLAHTSAYGVLTEDQVILQNLLEGTLREDSVLFVLIADADGNVLAQQAKQGAENQPGFAQLALAHASTIAPTIIEPAWHYHTIGTQEVYHVVAPVGQPDNHASANADRLATAMLLLNRDGAASTKNASPASQRGSVQLMLSLEEMQVKIRHTLLAGIALTLGTVLIGVLVSLGFCNYVLTPVQAVAKAATHIAAGDLTQRVPMQGSDEIGQLATAFNHMAESLDGMTQAQQQRLTELSAAYAQIEQLNIGLEAKVEERTETLRRQQTQLQEMNAHLEIANRHKSEFLANMSHELRTPLNAIIGFSEVLLEHMFGDLNERQDEYLNDILSSGQHLLSLINDILDLSKVEAGKMELERGMFDLKHLLEGSLVMIKERALAHNITLSLDLADDFSVITGDERKIKQVLFNLLSNAVKFTRDRGQVGIRAYGVPDAVEIAVWDTGIGIPVEEQERIFEEFQQVGHGLAGKTEGTGLGLALAKKFVEMHGGRMWVTSTSGEGSTFAFTLPLVGEDTTPVLAPPAEDQEGARSGEAAMPGARVLVIEDDPKGADLLRIYLTDAGYTVDLASDGAAGFTKAQQQPPDVIILDVLLPKVDGWALLTQLKADPITRDVPVIIASIMDQKGKGFALGAADYLIKPIQRSELLRTLGTFHLVAKEPQAVVTILAIDDDPKALELVATALEPEGVRVLRATDGATGLALAEAEQPDVIILDLLMPEMNGFEVLERLAQSPTTRDIPTIMFTVKDLTAEETQRLNGKITQLAHKRTVQQHDMVTLVKDALRQTTRERA